MARLILAWTSAALIAWPVHAGDYIRNTNGNVVCGKGQCMMAGTARYFAQKKAAPRCASNMER
jgi:hypothetical protein